MKTKFRLLGLILLSAFFLAACGEDEDPATSEFDCGQGTQMEVDDELFCIYSQSITEEGFSCPSSLSGPVSYGDLYICSAGEADGYPDLLFDELHDTFEGLPTGRCLTTTCSQGQACTGGTCEDRECWSDSECSEEMACINGFCEDTDPGSSCTSVPQGRVQGTDDWEEDELYAANLDEIELRPSPTSDTDELTPQWVLTVRPAGSQAQLSPNGEAEEPSLNLDSIGIYYVELSFVDDQGEVACDPSEIMLYAMSDGDILIQLTWDVPESPSGTGTDLDLHYLHPSGSWGESSPWEVSSANANGDWDDDGQVTLDIDDMTGDFPENIEHNDPGLGPYSAGVYYHSDNSEYGSTIATIRIYNDGILLFEDDQELENVGDFWWVGDITAGASGLTVTTDQPEHGVHNGFPDQ